MPETWKVPDLIGMPFHIARDELLERGIALAGSDPDGPPIGGVAWPGLFFISSQSPQPGATLGLGEAIKVTVVPDDENMSGVLSRPHPPQPSRTSEAEAQDTP